ncbi:MAG: hypothetical protein AB8F74_09685 [Saprospiraceae bacterium]
MKNSNFHLFILLVLLNISCNKEDDHTHPDDFICRTCEACVECEPALEYEDHYVNFYTKHKEYLLQHAEYEMITEQALLKPAHKEGALFDIATEQRLFKEESNRVKLFESKVIHLVANTETDSIAEVECYRFFSEDEIIDEVIPAEYKTRYFYTLVQDGTGPDIPATYETLVFRIVSSPAQLLLNEGDQDPVRIRFRIPKNINIQNYLQNQFDLHGIENCVEGNAYFLE